MTDDPMAAFRAGGTSTTRQTRPIMPATAEVDVDALIEQARQNRAAGSAPAGVPRPARKQSGADRTQAEVVPSDQVAGGSVELPADGRWPKGTPKRMRTVNVPADTFDALRTHCKRAGLDYAEAVSIAAATATPECSGRRRRDGLSLQKVPLRLPVPLDDWLTAEQHRTGVTLADLTTGLIDALTNR